MKIKCIVIDDEELARVLLTEYIEKIPNLELAGAFSSPLQALEVLQREKIDLVLLDIQMPDLTGIQFLKSLESKPVVIFTTAYPEFALEGYELDVVDYMVKPFTLERFLHGINKAIKILKGAKHEPDKINGDFLIVYADHKIYRIELSSILYIEGLREYVSYYTSDGKRIIALESLKKLEEILPKDKFIRTHRSYIVPINLIKVIEGNNVLINGKFIPIGVSYREEVLKRVT